MKTTIELPDEILRKAKVAAAESDTSLKDLFTLALERFLASTSKREDKARSEKLQQLLEKMKASNSQPMKPLSREDLHDR